LIKRECISCGLCRKDCLYLQTFGLPDEQAEEALAQRLNFSQFFSCSLCGLCVESCPVEALAYSRDYALAGADRKVYSSMDLLAGVGSPFTEQCHEL